MGKLQVVRVPTNLGFTVKSQTVRVPTITRKLKIVKLNSAEFFLKHYTKIEFFCEFDC
ncbi:hypothetical protein LEP1GSC172_1522 [Leptospira noguchii]|uniref:Uncharacterized protein n=2 Tax=Leptospira noguchii TaxID=28182 RepID=T0FJV9_9LEPT|nr:hypothetical protein LEP1GSC172_1522 [Leptospira noguchii]EQA70394.1 hypothetical protein LEP1GSC059_0623 [Leptospira noguchii serovar Panama str. CZ214]